MNSVKERVARGAAWLDSSEPGWRDSIDLAKLDLGSGEQCICGQVFASYTESSPVHFFDGKVNGFRLALLRAGAEDQTKWAYDHGFLIVSPPVDEHGIDLAAYERERTELHYHWHKIIHSARVRKGSLDSYIANG